MGAWIRAGISQGMELGGRSGRYGSPTAVFAAHAPPAPARRHPRPARPAERRVGARTRSRQRERQAGLGHPVLREPGELRRDRTCQQHTDRARVRPGLGSLTRRPETDLGPCPPRLRAAGRDRTGRLPIADPVRLDRADPDPRRRRRRQPDRARTVRDRDAARHLRRRRTRVRTRLRQRGHDLLSPAGDPGRAGVDRPQRRGNHPRALADRVRRVPRPRRVRALDGGQDDPPAQHLQRPARTCTPTPATPAPSPRTARSR